MSTQYTPLSIHIAAPRTAHILQTLSPDIARMNYETELHNRHIVFDWPSTNQYVIVTDEQFQRLFGVDNRGADPRPWFFQPLLVEER